MTSPFGGRPTLGFMTTRSSNKRKLSEDCCEIARKNHLDQLVKNVNKEIDDLKRNDSLESRQFYVDHIQLVKMSSCVLFRKILEEIAETEADALFNAQKTLDAWDACENRKYGKGFEDKWASEDTMSWQDTLLKDGRLTKKLYEIVRDEMFAEDVHSIDDLYKKVMARWDEPQKPTKKQVQRVLGYILTRRRIR
jgi:hypothetical protein